MMGCNSFYRKFMGRESKIVYLCRCHPPISAVMLIGEDGAEGWLPCCGGILIRGDLRSRRLFEHRMLN